jgi:hypothetical protein
MVKPEGMHREPSFQQELLEVLAPIVDPTFTAVWDGGPR